MQHHLSNAELVIPTIRQAEQATAENERWSTPVAALFVVASAGTLWVGIFALARLILG